MPQINKVKVSGSTIPQHTRRTPSGNITEVVEHERSEHWRELHQELKRTTPRIPATKRKLNPEIIRAFKGYRDTVDNNYEEANKRLERIEELETILSGVDEKDITKERHRQVLWDYGVYISKESSEWRWRRKKYGPDGWLAYADKKIDDAKASALSELDESTKNKEIADKMNVEKEIIRAHVLQEAVKEIKTQDKMAKKKNLANYKEYKEKLQEQITKEDIEKVAKEWQLTPREDKINKLEHTTREHWPEGLHRTLWYIMTDKYFRHEEFKYQGWDKPRKKNPHYDKEYHDIDSSYERKSREIDRIVTRITQRADEIEKAKKMGLLTKAKHRTNLFETADGALWVTMDGRYFKSDVRKKKLSTRTERGWKKALHGEPKKIVKMYDRSKMFPDDIHREIFLRREHGIGLEDWLDDRTKYEQRHGLLMDQSRFAALIDEDIDMAKGLTSKHGYREIDPSKFKVTEETIVYDFPSKKKRKYVIYSKDTAIPLLAGAIQEKTKKGVKTTEFDAENYTWVAAPHSPLAVQPKDTELIYLLAPMQPEHED